MTNPIDELSNLTEGQANLFKMYRDAFDEWEKDAAGSDGWWKSDTTDTLFATFMKLVDGGFSTDAAFDILDTLIGVIKSEYGE